MTQPTDSDIAATLNGIARASTHPRELAREAVARYRQGSAISAYYDFNSAPVELRRVIYDAAVRFSRRRWWSKLLR